MTKTIYLAGSLFSEGERAWCRKVKRALEEGVLGMELIRVNWPWDSVGKLDLEGKTPTEMQRLIAEDCKQGVVECNILVVLLDTIPTDDGTAFELGYQIGRREAAGSRIKVVPVIGLRTDERSYGDSGAPLNAMIGAHIDRLCTSLDELVRVVHATVMGLRGSC